MPLPFKLQEFLDGVNRLSARMEAMGVEPTPQSARQAMSELCRFQTPGPAVALVVDRTVVHDAITVPVRIYSPHPQKPLPVMVYLHGGGHMCGSVALYDAILRKLATAAGVVLVAVDYRLTPEHPYPAGLADCRAVVKRVFETVGSIPHQQRLFLGGDSAGGALAATLVMENQDNRAVAIEKQVLIYPSLDYTMSALSHQTCGSGYLLESRKIEWYFDAYFQNHEDRAAASPLFGPFSSKMPQTLVVTGEFDPLRDEGIAYGEKVIAQGVYAEHHHFAGMIHAFLNLEQLVPDEAAAVYRKIAAFLNRDPKAGES